MRAETETPHLTDQELFELALPPAGQPEALPRHLSGCLACSRALQAWKGAVRELAQEDADVIEQRSPREWEALEETTLEAIRRSGRIRPRLRWAIAIAASLVLVALLVPARRTAAPAPMQASAELSPQDQADDALLREVASLTQAEDSESGWSALAPEPSSGEPGEGKEL
ncbi:MAG: hypothetical protein ACRD1P_09630 [Thermoanaerobaculia bacterium]